MWFQVRPQFLNADWVRGVRTQIAPMLGAKAALWSQVLVAANGGEMLENVMPPKL
jgi:hypothetical protein